MMYSINRNKLNQLIISHTLHDCFSAILSVEQISNRVLHPEIVCNSFLTILCFFQAYTQIHTAICNLDAISSADNE